LKYSYHQSFLLVLDDCRHGRIRKENSLMADDEQIMMMRRTMMMKMK
jgi:hypothetical protein